MPIRQAGDAVKFTKITKFIRSLKFSLFLIYEPVAKMFCGIEVMVMLQLSGKFQCDMCYREGVTLGGFFKIWAP
jgi:hypothetical protein